MEAFERRMEIVRVLCIRRHDTIPNLANEFEVSKKTIRRDIHDLSFRFPIYTQCGPHGGVFVMPEFSMLRMYMKESEIAILTKLLYAVEEEQICNLNDEELKKLKYIISQYTKPVKKKA